MMNIKNKKLVVIHMNSDGDGVTLGDNWKKNSYIHIYARMLVRTMKSCVHFSDNHTY
jgi:hypothetical protein